MAENTDINLISAWLNQLYRSKILLLNLYHPWYPHEWVPWYPAEPRSKRGHHWSIPQIGGKRGTVIYLIEEYFDSLCLRGETPQPVAQPPKRQPKRNGRGIEATAFLVWKIHMAIMAIPNQGSGCARALVEQGHDSRSFCYWFHALQGSNRNMRSGPENWQSQN